jgi:hypothetical protein
MFLRPIGEQEGPSSVAPVNPGRGRGSWAETHPAAPEALQHGTETEVRTDSEGSHQQRPQERGLPQFPIPLGPEVEDRFLPE